MKRTSEKKPAVVVSRCVLCIALASFFIFGGSVLTALRRMRVKAGVRTGCHLAARHGVVFLAGFDEVSPHDAVSRAGLTHWDAPRVAGRCGDARRIDLDRNPVMRFPATRFAVKTETSSFTAWFRPRDVMRRQLLFAQRNSESGFKLTLENGGLSLSVSDCATNVFSSCRYIGAPDRFTHVALVFEGDRAAVFQNGRETASLRLVRPFVSSSVLFGYGADVHDPFEGDLDDVAIWSRALPPKELKTLAGSNCGIRRMYAPVHSLIENAADAAAGFTAGLYRSVGRLVPPLKTPAQFNGGIPKMTLWTSAKDERVFMRAHESSLHSGFRTPKAASFRSVDVSFGGRTASVEMALDDVYGCENTLRPAFILKDPSRTVFTGCGMVRLYPPELHAALHQDAAFPLPLSGSFVRMFHEETFKGLYVMEPFERTGGAWMARGARQPLFRYGLYFDSPPAPCDIPPPGCGPDEAFSSVRSLVLTDALFPWSRQEIASRCRFRARDRAAGEFAPPPVSRGLAACVLADNPSPMFVTNDLALAASGVKWESSDPALIAPDGRVTRPLRGAPKPVTLTPIGADGSRGESLRFRVAPVAPDLQTLFLYIGFPVEKHRRVDVVCLRVPAGGGDPEWIFGTGDSGGGIKHRGNTSYVKGAKRSFSLEFDDDVDWTGSGRGAQHVMLFSGYADASRLHNKVSFDAFRLAASKGVPCGAVQMSWSEVFVNGEYFGVWETCRRVKDVCDPGTHLYKVRSRNPDLWAAVDTGMADCISAHDPRGDTYEPLESLFKFTSGVSGEEFAAEVGNVFHVGSIIDFCLMLNFSANFDGYVTNQYIGRSPGDGRWFIVPWDYDKTFSGGAPCNLTNRLISKMLADVPGFRESLSEKWRTLRAGPMSDESVIGRIDADAALLAPYMDEEYRLLKPLGWDGDFAAAVNLLKTVVCERLKLMDARFLSGGAKAAK